MKVSFASQKFGSKNFNKRYLFKVFWNPKPFFQKRFWWGAGVKPLHIATPPTAQRGARCEFACGKYREVLWNLKTFNNSNDQIQYSTFRGISQDVTV
jgi:hypothetical protein